MVREKAWCGLRWSGYVLGRGKDAKLDRGLTIEVPGMRWKEVVENDTGVIYSEKGMASDREVERRQIYWPVNSC